MILKIIEDFSDERLDAYARLTEAQIMHPQKGSGSFIAESPKVIERAIEAGYTPVSILAEKKLIQTQVEPILALTGDIPVFTAETELLENLTGYKLTRGILCQMLRKELPSLDSVLDGAARIAVLKNIMNPTNVGAIFRSAAALGMDAVVLTDDCSDPLYRRSVRVSMGGVFQIPWTVTENVSDVESHGFSTVALALKEDTMDICNLPSDAKLALVLGSEGDGLPDNVISSCTYRAKIPMYHGVDSLNVASAAAVAFYVLRSGLAKK